MAEQDPSKRDPLMEGPTLSADGRLEGRLARVEQPPPDPTAGEPLELAHRGPKAGAPPEKPYRALFPSRRRQLAVRIVVAAVALGVGLFALGLLRRPPHTKGLQPDTVRESSVLDTLLSGGPKPPLIVTSEPGGATIRIGGQIVGTTPWAGDNVWVGAVPVVVELSGHQPWKGTLRGGEESTLKATLKPLHH